MHVRNRDSSNQISNNLYRSNIKKAGDQVTVFNSESIKTNPLVSLSREAFYFYFFMATLQVCGGDYDMVSLLPTVSFKLSLSYLGWTQRLWMENCSFTCPE
jgi:hypothetical protein